MRKIGFLFILILWCCNMLHAQQLVNKYWVYFTDKNNSPYSINQPLTFLSERSIARRERMDIAIRVTDLPVNPEYVQQLKNNAVSIKVESRWLNAVSVEINDAAQLAVISTLPFVKSIEPVQRYIWKEEDDIPKDNSIFCKTVDTYSNNYGASYNQNHMIDVDFLHALGYTGQGIQIAVLDGGFYGVDSGNGFKSFRDKDQIIETRNFPDENDSVYFSATHGSNVLSIMGADNPGSYIGSGPDARFYLFRTEIVDSEYVVEEDYWLQAAEYADVVGADIINSSLGYTTFDDSTENHTYADMDGNTTVITKAADAAAAAGILVVSSAGNSATDIWHFIGAPADADSILTVGAVDVNGNYAFFSSVGPTFDGRIKPNIAGQGAGTAVVSETGIVTFGSGTSYSSPLIAGACASLLSAFPELTNMEVIDILQRSATQSDNPDNFLGYGIPSFARAYLELKGITLQDENIINIIPNPAEDVTSVYINATETGNGNLTLFDVTGKAIWQQSIALSNGNVTPVIITGLQELASGIYILHLAADIYSESQLLMVK